MTAIALIVQLLEYTALEKMNIAAKKLPQLKTS